VVQANHQKYPSVLLLLLHPTAAAGPATAAAMLLPLLMLLLLLLRPTAAAGPATAATAQGEVVAMRNKKSRNSIKGSTKGKRE
jgi:hypothetical protein